MGRPAAPSMAAVMSMAIGFGTMFPAAESSAKVLSLECTVTGFTGPRAKMFDKKARMEVDEARRTVVFIPFSRGAPETFEDKKVDRSGEHEAVDTVQISPKEILARQDVFKFAGNTRGELVFQMELRVSRTSGEYRFSYPDNFGELHIKFEWVGTCEPVSEKPKF